MRELTKQEATERGCRNCDAYAKTYKRRSLIRQCVHDECIYYEQGDGYAEYIRGFARERGINETLRYSVDIVDRSMDS